MNLEAIIIDDEVNNIKILRHFIKQYCPTIIIIGIATTKADAIKLINNVQPQLIFLDIILKMEVIRKLLLKNI